MSTTPNDGGQALKLPIDMEIKSVDGAIILVSPEDYARVQGDAWRIGANGYVYRRGGRTKGVPCLLHRIILGATPGQEVHHGHGGKLDNTRRNLELTTPSAHQKTHHIGTLISRNHSRKRHSDESNCVHCGVLFMKNPNHRGRQTCCSKRCAMLRAISVRTNHYHAR